MPDGKSDEWQGTAVGGKGLKGKGRPPTAQGGGVRGERQDWLHRFIGGPVLGLMLSCYHLEILSNF